MADWGKYVEEKIYIAGAHSRAQTLGRYLQYLHSGISIESYLYDNDESNPEEIGGVRVVCLKEGVSLHTCYPVYIGTRGIYHWQITKHLRRLGFEKIIPVTVELDLYLRNRYMEKYFNSIGREFLKIDRLTGDSRAEAVKAEKPERPHRTVAVYVAVSTYDKPLRQNYSPATYEKEIRTGVTLSGQLFPVSVIADNRGDNISNKNCQFCELTALYWIWKHACEDIIGLAQYRRHFTLPEDWITRMEENAVDVILPVPLYVYPSLAGNYKNRHDSSDWDYMMEYLRKRNQAEYQEAEIFFRTNLYSPCNMFIMRKAVLNELCEWLFPILFAVAEHGGEKKDRYQNRYPGFISERLITFFFEKKRDKYKVVYSDKRFLK